MVKQVAAIRIGCFCLAMVCAAPCQNSRPQAAPAQALPDAPSARLSPSITLERVVDEAHLPAAADAVAENAKTVAEADRTHVIFAMPQSLPGLYEAAPAQKEAPDFFGKHVYPSLLNAHTRYQASDSDRWMGRATDAASQILLTRDESGHRRLNTSYLLRVATAVAAHSASRPYWLRSGSEPISDFGSTVGNDAGINLLHEFGPAVRHAVSSHLPEFVTRIGAGIERSESHR